MDITCTQMDVLLSFYIEGDLSNSLKNKVEEHLESCSICRAKYDIIKSMLNDIRDSVGIEDFKDSDDKVASKPFVAFKTKLSEYIDNELSGDENIKVKKYTISNQKARNELENFYNLRKIMNNSFKKSKNEFMEDFSKKIMKQIIPNYNEEYMFNPIIKAGAAFVLTVLMISAVVIFILSY